MALIGMARTAAAVLAEVREQQRNRDGCDGERDWGGEEDGPDRALDAVHERARSHQPRCDRYQSMVATTSRSLLLIRS